MSRSVAFRVASMPSFWSKWFRPRTMSDAEYAAEKERLLKSAPVPRLWLLGKTGSGKTSIIRCLTGAADAEIGNGFRPQTRTSREFAFPSDGTPVMRFVDTRGLGEARYDAAEDLTRFDAETQLVVVVARAMDHALGDLVETLRAVRASRPDRPVLLALTWLHEAYPGAQHPDPDPFTIEFPGDARSRFHVPDSVGRTTVSSPESTTPSTPATGTSLESPPVPEDLARSLEAQRTRFDGLVDAIVPIDLTADEEGFQEPEFGGERLKDAILALLPGAYRQSFAGFEEARKTLRGMNEARALPEIYAHSVLAATAAAVPVPWVDIPAVVAVQSNLVRRLAGVYGQEMSMRTMLDLAGAAGGRMLLRFLIREPLKLIPFVGMAANAAMAFGYTYGLGRACCWYFGERKRGNTPSTADVAKVWQDASDVAKKLWERRRAEP